MRPASRGSKSLDSKSSKSLMSSSTERMKISVQYRSKQTKVFELTDGAIVLAVSIVPPEGEGALEVGTWRVETRLGTGTGPSLADGSGATAADALRSVATAWRAHELASLDWDAVVRVLHVVNAV